MTGSWPSPAACAAGSHNTALLRAAIEAAPEGVEVELFDPSGDRRPAALRPGPRHGRRSRSRWPRLREAWGSADALLFATPEYNGSIPGGLKNAIDWASRPRLEAALTNKTVAVMGASHRPVRRHVGAGRPAQDPRHRRRPRGRRRAARHARAREVRLVGASLSPNEGEGCSVAM